MCLNLVTETQLNKINLFSEQKNYNKQINRVFEKKANLLETENVKEYNSQQLLDILIALWSKLQMINVLFTLFVINRFYKRKKN